MDLRKWLPALDSLLPTGARVVVRSAEQLRDLSAGEVRSPETYNHVDGTPVLGGLMCTHRFGPLRDLECSCGRYRGRERRGCVCESCGDCVLPASSRSTTFGHLELDVPALHPWLAPLASQMLGWSESELRSTLRYENAAAAESGPHAVLARLEHCTSDSLDVPAQVMVRVVLVLPPGLRPTNDDDVNHLYRRLMNRNNRLRRLRELNAPDEYLRTEEKMVQDAVDALFDNEHRGVVPGPNKRLLRSLGARTLSALKRDPDARTELRCMGFDVEVG